MIEALKAAIIAGELMVAVGVILMAWRELKYKRQLGNIKLLKADIADRRRRHKSWVWVRDLLNQRKREIPWIFQ